MICEHKSKLRTKRDARRFQTNINRTLKQKGDKTRFYIYKCPDCKFYHLTKIKKWIKHRKEKPHQFIQDS